MIRTISAAGFATACALAAHADPIQLTPGDWSTVVVITAGEITDTQNMDACMGADESNLEPTELASRFAGGAECTASNVQQNGNTVTFSMSCGDQALKSADLTLKHTPTSFTLSGPIVLNIGEGMDLPAEMDIEATRVGPCSD